MLFQGIFPYPSIPGTAYEVTLENRKVAIKQGKNYAKLFMRYKLKQKNE